MHTSTFYIYTRITNLTTLQIIKIRGGKTTAVGGIYSFAFVSTRSSRHGDDTDIHKTDRRAHLDFWQILVLRSINYRVNLHVDKCSKSMGAVLCRKTFVGAYDTRLVRIPHTDSEIPHTYSNQKQRTKLWFFSLYTPCNAWHKCVSWDNITPLSSQSKAR